MGSFSGFFSSSPIFADLPYLPVLTSRSPALSLAVPIHQSIIQPASEQQALQKTLLYPKVKVPYRYIYQQTHSTPDRKNLPAKGSGKPI